MAEKISKKALLDVLTQYGEGAKLQDIAKHFPLSAKSVLRRLAELANEGGVVVSGKGPAVRYRINPEVLQPGVEAQQLIPLSEKARQVNGLVSLPPAKRQPIGYSRDFLASYIPNKTSYLSTDEKQQLATVGATAQLNAPAGTYAKQILQRLLIDLAWNSSRLEGNTYSLLDTKRLLDDGVSAGDKPAMEAQMILNHKDAIEFIVNNDEGIGMNRYTVLNLHALLSNNLLPDPAAQGRLRTHAVGIGASVYVPLSLPQPIEEMFNLMLEKAASIEDSFEQAFFIMVQLPYLQPFDDVNKRVSRLAANIPLNQKNLSPLSFTEVPQQMYINGLLGVYELNDVALLKDVFIWAYERSAKQYAAQRQSLGEPDMFRMKYRSVIRQLVAEIITERADKASAQVLIRAKVLHIPLEDRDKFILTVEQELLSLHEGNFARYYVTPSQFAQWQEAWGK